MKIVSLLPSATEIVYLLGLDGWLRGRSFECDHPVEVATVPIVSGTALPTDGSATSAEIDAAVTASVAAGESLYTLDTEQIRAIGPDLIISQDLCQVCAVPAGAVGEALAVIGCRSEVLSLDPMRLDDVIEGIGVIGRATGTEALAIELMAGLRGRLDSVVAGITPGPRPKVLLLEWGDPPFSAGHWMPDMVVAAGGEPILAGVGERSGRLTWDQIAAEPIDVVVFAPCGFDLAAAIEQALPLLERVELAHAGQFWAVDANSYFSRPGPRVVDGVELLAGIVAGSHGVSGRSSRLR